MKIEKDRMLELRRNNKRNISRIDKILVHCSDSDVEKHDDISVINTWHLERGWICVGYHYFICKKEKGLIQYGRPIQYSGAHCKGHNKFSVAICLAGRNEFSRDQFTSLGFLISSIRTILEQDIDVATHHDYDSGKTCPNFRLTPAIERLYRTDQWAVIGGWDERNIKDALTV